MNGKQEQAKAKIIALAVIGWSTCCLGLVVLCWGWVVDDWNQVLLGLGMLITGYLVRLPWIIRRKKKHREARENEEALEILELERIRNTMTPAEWELYKVQRLNQELLKQIRSKPAGTSGPRGVYGVVNDISD